MSRLLDQAFRAYESGQPAEALRYVTDMFQAFDEASGLPLFPAGVRRADELLTCLGRDLYAVHKAPLHSDQPLSGDLILATHVYVAGGHTPVIKDLTSALPQRPLALWLTKARSKGKDQVSERALQRTGLADLTKTFGGEDPWHCTNHMLKALTELRPARIFLLHHPDDCVAVIIAAAAASMGSTICLLHHADSKPSCGLYLEGTRVYDFTPRAYAFSQFVLRVNSAWLPLTCPDPQAPAHLFMSEGPIVTALSSSLGKVREIRSPDYPELVSAILKKTGGRHVHIGPLDETTHKEVLSAMRSKGISGDRIRWVRSAPTLVDALIENNVDLMINTYPRGGARTAVETMAAGRAMIWHSPSTSLDRLNAQMRYPDAPIWHNLDELLKILDRVDRHWLEQQGASARNWYDTRHHPRIWVKALADFDLALQREPPEGFDLGLIMDGFLAQVLDIDERKGNMSQPKRIRRLPFWPFQ